MDSYSGNDVYDFGVFSFVLRRESDCSALFASRLPESSDSLCRNHCRILRYFHSLGWIQRFGICRIPYSAGIHTNLCGYFFGLLSDPLCMRTEAE